ncbi:MAG TPA: HNH endonuclease, partial [Candidatus Acidoferrum sp.]|nr:HNH endonuclease [Candidatus Acidoferrum sp.]
MRPPDELIFRRDEFRCAYCDLDGKLFENWVFLCVDHFKPQSRGGDDKMENLKTSCVSCNHMKGAQQFPD